MSDADSGGRRMVHPFLAVGALAVGALVLGACANDEASRATTPETSG